MEPSFLLIGSLTRDYLLPPTGQPLLDSPGGSLLYAAGGLAVWDAHLGLVGRVGEDYPRPWLKDLGQRGWDVTGIRIQHGALDQRNFLAYTESFEASRVNPVSHFARRGIPFPKALLGYQPPHDSETGYGKPDPASPSLSDIPANYLDAGALHICPLGLGAHLHFMEALRGAVRALTLEPSAAYMTPAFLREVRGLVHGMTAFLPSLEEITALFWGQTNDPWEMAAALGDMAASSWSSSAECAGNCSTTRSTVSVGRFPPTRRGSPIPPARAMPTAAAFWRATEKTTIRSKARCAATSRPRSPSRVRGRSIRWM
jgi:hypothetical protein